MVDLPAPDGPTTATVFPAGTVKLTPFSTIRVRLVGEHHIRRSGSRRRVTTSGLAPGLSFTSCGWCSRRNIASMSTSAWVISR